MEDKLYQTCVGMMHVHKCSSDNITTRMDAINMSTTTFKAAIKMKTRKCNNAGYAMLMP